MSRSHRESDNPIVIAIGHAGPFRANQQYRVPLCILCRTVRGKPLEGRLRSVFPDRCSCFITRQATVPVALVSKRALQIFTLFVYLNLDLRHR